MAPPFPLPTLPPLFEILALLVLLIIGAIILIAVVKIVFLFLPAVIIAIVVWFLTESWFWAGVAFLVIAVLSITRRR